MALANALCTRAGTAIASCGEDGQVKVWSKSLMLRSTLYQSAAPVLQLAWNPTSEALAFCSGQSIYIRNLQSTQQMAVDGAHEGLVLALDWATACECIVSGGEDGRFKVW